MAKVFFVIFILLFLVAWVGFPDIMCPYKARTGKPCLFCGTLTSLSLTAHGKIKEAWRVNPVGSIIFLVVGLGLGCRFGSWVKVRYNEYR